MGWLARACTPDRSGQYVDITDAAVDHQPFPAVSRGFLGDHVTQQGATQGTTTIDYQHLAGPRLVRLLLDQRVVFEAFDGDDLAAKGISAAEITEHRLDHLHQVRVGVAQVGSHVMIH
jgi:hypothetical protein